MFTYEKVLSVYAGMLSADEDIEIVSSKNGYVGLVWDRDNCVLYDAEFLETPEAMKGFILSSYETLQHILLTKGKRKLTNKEAEKLFSTVEAMSDLCT